MTDIDAIPEERRRAARAELEAPVTVSWSERSGRYRRESATLRNRSDNGAELQFREALHEGTRILTEDEDSSRWGEVRHSTPDPAGGYRVGVQFESDEMLEEDTGW